MLSSLVLIESDLKFDTRKRKLARSFSLEKCEEYLSSKFVTSGSYVLEFLASSYKTESPELQC